MPAPGRNCIIISLAEAAIVTGFFLFSAGIDPSDKVILRLIEIGRTTRAEAENQVIGLRSRFSWDQAQAHPDAFVNRTHRLGIDCCDIAI